MSKSFYSSKEYKQKQSLITKRNWAEGKFDFKIKRVSRFCVREDCNISFDVKPSNPKKYCSSSCSAIVRNTGRKQSREAREKIRTSIIGKKYPNRRINSVKGIKKDMIFSCRNDNCLKKFTVNYWRSINNLPRYCSNICSISDVGSRPTSHKASKGVYGVRKDLGGFKFFSRWEANFARMLNKFEILWEYQSHTFDLIYQKYTPDFYLPDYDTFIEIKNYLSDYSGKRDEIFRDLYSEEKLILVLKNSYIELEKAFSKGINNWEFGRVRRRKVFSIDILDSRDFFKLLGIEQIEKTR